MFTFLLLLSTLTLFPLTLLTVFPLTFLLPEFWTFVVLRSVVVVLELAVPVDGFVVVFEVAGFVVAVFVVAVFVDALEVVAGLAAVLVPALFCCALLSNGKLIAAINIISIVNQLDFFPIFM
jgi:hypothetical protein